MCCHLRYLLVAFLALLCGCGGGGSSTTTTSLPSTSAGNAAASAPQSVRLGSTPTRAEIPVVSEIRGTLLFPAVDVPATVTVSASAAAPEGSASGLRRAQSGTLTVYEFVTIVSPMTITLPSIPAITLQFPAATPLAGKSMYYGISDTNAQGGIVSFDTQGPGTISGQIVAFPQIATPLTFEALHKYTFVVYSTTSLPAAKIYVVNNGNNSVTTYRTDGNPTTPTIAKGLDGPTALAVDSAGKIYIANVGPAIGPDGQHASYIATFNPDGAPATPTITSAVSTPTGVDVDASGKIYVGNLGTASLTSYLADGSLTTPTIFASENNPVFAPTGVAVDKNGKIFVTNLEGPVTTYNATGSLTSFTITAGLHSPLALTVDGSGKIYVANYGNNTVTTYNANGSPSITITAGLNRPLGVAVDTAGKIYVTNSGNDTVTTYSATGMQTTPTITGLSSPYGITVR